MALRQSKRRGAMAKRTKGRTPIDRELETWRARVAVINDGLIACYETITEGQRQKAELEARINERMRSEA